MTTARQLITRSLRTIGAITATETPSAEDLSAGVDALNDVLAALSARRGAIPALSNHAVTLAASDGQYSIGSGADFDKARPLRVESAYVTMNNADVPLDIGTCEDYNALPNKALIGPPNTVYYDATSANGTLYFFPVPDASYACVLTCWTEFTQVSGANDSLVLPTYLVAYLRYAVAVILAAEMQRPIDPAWVEMRDSLYASMATLHRDTPKAKFDIHTAKPYNIEIG